MTRMKIKIRKASKKDLEQIYKIEKRSYPPSLQATNKILRYRAETFGIWTAKVNNKIVGFFTCVPIRLSWPKPDTKKILKNRHPKYIPWFEEYKKGGKFNTLWITSTAVETKYQKRGAGTALVKYSLQLAKKLGLSYRASALRCQYGYYYNKTGKSIRSYIEKVKKGRIKDRFLSLYSKLGLNLVSPLPNYELYKESLNYNVLAYKKLNKNCVSENLPQSQEGCKKGYKSLVAGWSLTKRCNLKCIHCYNASGKQSKDELTLEEAKKVADKLKRGGSCCC